MTFGAAVLVIFAVALFLAPVQVWLMIASRLALVALVIAVAWAVWLKPHLDADNIRARIVELEYDINWFTPKCEKQKLGERDLIYPDFDSCAAVERDKQSLAALRR